MKSESGWPRRLNALFAFCAGLRKRLLAGSHCSDFDESLIVDKRRLDVFQKLSVNRM